jgi:hypothetical protein
MSQKLLPCPFCGSDAETTNAGKTASCANHNCGLYDATFEIGAWNTRANHIVDANKMVEPFSYPTVEEFVADCPPSAVVAYIKKLQGVIGRLKGDA